MSLFCKVPVDELKQASQLLCEALFIRAKYMALSMQSFCPTTAKCIQEVSKDYNLSSFYEKHGDTWLNHRGIYTAIILQANFLSSETFKVTAKV